MCQEVSAQPHESISSDVLQSVISKEFGLKIWIWRTLDNKPFLVETPITLFFLDGIYAHRFGLDSQLSLFPPSNRHNLN